MPELPEVETIRRYLQNGTPDYPSILGRTVSAARLYWPKTLAEPDAEAFTRRIAGHRVESVGRRGKYLLLHLPPETLLIHLRMSGDLRLEPIAALNQPHDRLYLDFVLLPGEDRRWRLAFNDTRKFGRLWLLDDPQRLLGKLGPEPLEDAFTAEWLANALSTHRRQLKPLLLDQGFIAGLGNIYTDEALHRAGLHPLTLASAVTPPQAARLWQSIRLVLQEGIQRQGASIDWVYRGGDFQNYFGVYQRTGQPCPVCGTPIQRLVVGQRGTHFCPECQKADR